MDQLDACISGKDVRIKGIETAKFSAKLMKEKGAFWR